MTGRSGTGAGRIGAAPGWHGGDLLCYFHATGFAPGAITVLGPNTY